MSQIGQADEYASARPILEQLALEAQYTAASNKLAVMGPDARVRLLILGLQDSEIALQRAAAAALSLERDTRSFEPFLKIYLEAQDEQLRSSACSGLQNLADPRCLSVMLEEMQSSDWQRRLSAVWIIGAINHPTAVEALNRALRDPKPQVRKAAKGGFIHRRLHGLAPEPPSSK